ncbi:MAG: hypothetical protein HUK03_09765 [Bacteroidaceae bacterium]|nr:hypothetical protein [Bacteroidaceae bacterium]
MKKILIFAVGILVMASCGMNKEKTEAQQRELDSLRHVISNREGELNNLMGTINEVQESIQRINEAEGRITIAEGSSERASSQEIIRENMQYIQEAMKQNRETIAKLEEKMKNSSIKSDKLQKTIANLQTQVEQQAKRIQELEASLAEKDIQIAQQGQQITTLNANVETLTADNQAKQETVEKQDKELNTAWFVFGTKSELKEQKIMVDGTVLKNNNFNKDYFTKIDIRYDKEVKFYSKSAKLMTTHPAGSYELVKDSKGQYELHITDPQNFWSVSKYLVVLVK